MINVNTNYVNQPQMNTKQEVTDSYSQQTYKKVLNNIQQNYLVQNQNGTFTIKKIAYSLYPEKIMNTITQGMESMNKEILAGNIKFSFTTKNGVKVVNKTYLNEEKFFNPEDSANPINGLELINKVQFIHQYGYDFNYNWAGFYCDLNPSGCYILGNNIGTSIAAAGGASAIAGITGDIPVAMGMGILATAAVHMQGQLLSGGETGSGCTVDAWGSPMGNYVLYNASVN